MVVGRDAHLPRPDGHRLVSAFDIAVVGGGIVGLAAATAIAERLPGVSLVVLEKEPEVATHQTGHNSGVVHSGLYYKPGSRKAELCVRGQRALGALCDTAGIPLVRNGKLVVATSDAEIPALDTLHQRGIANGLEGLRRLGPDELTEVEPHATGVAALHVPETGVVDFPAIARHLAGRLDTQGLAEVRTSSGVLAGAVSTEGTVLATESGAIDARLVVNCAGLHSDRVAAMLGIDPPVRIVPFRGEYYELAHHADHLVRSLIYPVPDPRFPFLGVHFTRRHDGSVEVGPNAVLALGREFYRGARPNLRDLTSAFTYPGTWRIAARYWREGAKEMWRSASRTAYAKAAAALVPGIGPDDLIPAGAGVRAQAVGRDGTLVDDFVIVESDTAIHVLNAPSPAATASLAIGDHIAGLAVARLAG